MTKFELKDDYRTAVSEALGLLGLSQNDVHSATTYHELFANLTPAKQRLALAAVEVYKQFSFRERSATIWSSRDIYDLMKPHLQDVGQEESWVVLLNMANKCMKKVRISVGGIDSTIVDVRLVLKEAICASASALVLVHNHPSGSLRPSSADDRLTERLQKACEVMSVRLNDHIIFTDNGYYSYSDEGRI